MDGKLQWSDFLIVDKTGFIILVRIHGADGRLFDTHEFLQYFS